MNTCARCGGDLKTAEAFCSFCGAPTAAGETPSAELATTEPSSSSRASAATTAGAPLRAPTQSAISTARFATLVVLLVVVIGALVGVLVTMTRSDSKPSAAGAAGSESVATAASATAPFTTTTAAPVVQPVIAARFSADTVEVGQGLTITARETNGVGVDSATLTVDGHAVPASWTHTKYSWTTTWQAPGRDGRHTLRVTIASNAVTKTIARSVSVRLPVPVASAVVRIQQLIDAFKKRNLPAAQAIQLSPPKDLIGYADLNDGRILYVSYTVPSPNVYDIRAGYVVHQLVPPGGLDGGQQDTAYFCGVWRVDENITGPNVYFVKVVAIEQRTTESWPAGNAQPGWLPFESYRARLGECAAMNLG